MNQAMPAGGFRLKLLAAMMAVVIGVTAATFYAAQTWVQETYAQLFAELFRAQNKAFADQQQAFLETIRQACSAIVQSRRLQVALREIQNGGDPADLDDRAVSEFDARKVLRSETGPSGMLAAEFYLFLDEDGAIVPPAERALRGLLPLEKQKELKQQLGKTRAAMQRMTVPLAGYLTPETTNGEKPLYQAVFTRIQNPRDEEVLGAMILGFPPPAIPAKPEGKYRLKSGIWFEGRLFMPSMPEQEKRQLLPGIAAHIEQAKDEAGGFDVSLSEGGAPQPQRVFIQPIANDPDLPHGYLVAMVSLQEELLARGNLRSRILLFGGLGILGALIVSALLSHGLSGPIRDLVAATIEIQRGHFDIAVPVRSRDELGHLAGSFNEMAQGLALKEKYRSVLDKVADPKVAEELMNGSFALGGERREISVLFCDIRGFTALTQGMDPAEVVTMLNEHFTPLTRVVNQHHGVVDKFVGDLIMAVFGAPKSYGDDTQNAALCALAMIRERQQLNQTSKYKIEMGIGVASGPALAGCMGSVDRLNYTVLGERVNLASRLCSKAGRMEVVIDQTTRDRLGTAVASEPLAELELKGFTGRVPAFRLLASSPSLSAPAIPESRNTL